ncbi:glycosyltransferase [Clostridium sp. P21]|uniref:Glycosyltransferase n=1 Tax=Clostridium muellerianum TaxID=2716538 RepID=A0A7Y0EDH8_9CLOT|nr:glycosyltransferase [Clostridium muellerianum]NMM61481.1 glycosyltransferase [Clostridium muellerianum]
MSKKKISAVMAVYNREKYLKEAIDSVINQSYDNWELILVNDASTDGSHYICEEYSKEYPQKVKYINLKENGGAGNSFYTGTVNASGDYITFIGSDDIQLEDKFKISIDYLEVNPHIDMVFSNYETMSEDGIRTGRKLTWPNNINDNNKLLDNELRRNYMFSGLCVMKNTKNAIFDKNLRYSEDYDFFLNLVCKGYKAFFMDEALALVRIHDNNMSARYKETNEAVKFILNKYDVEDLYNKLKLNNLNHNRIHNTLGIFSIIKESYEQALHCFEKFNFNSYSKEDFCDNLFYKATVYYYLKKYKECMECLNNVLEYLPEEPTIFNNIAVVNSILENNNDIYKYLLKALELEPLYMDAKLNNESLKKSLVLNRFTTKFLRKNVVHEENALLK